ncbi:MAG: endolytic transglycosylase MltG [Chloroflexi bacterium]|nr:endolytic transglycosylase MltG [Chloroflexota bacterium]
MKRTTRIALRIFTLVVAISAVVIVVSVAFVYMLGDARSRAPQTGYVLTADTLERTALGLYLRFRTTDLNAPANPDDSTMVEFAVSEGESLYSIANRLQKAGIVSDSGLFRRYAQYAGTDVDIQAGAFSLSPAMTIEQVMQELQHGRKASVTVVIREGLRTEEIGAILEEAGVVSAQDFITVVQQGQAEADFIGSRPEGSPVTLEGFLYPDTYNFSKNATAEEIVQIMLQNWQDHIPESVRELAGRQGLTLYRTMILASIVEREAQIQEERPIIAGVYINRLNQSIMLQSDPTVQYAKGYDQATASWWAPLTLEDLDSVQSVYNTYIHYGLPPAPICNPGLSSIEAAINPQASDFLYFYAKGDGSHAFAVTYEEHLANMEQYGTP